LITNGLSNNRLLTYGMPLNKHKYTGWKMFKLSKLNCKRIFKCYLTH